MVYETTKIFVYRLHVYLCTHDPSSHEQLNLGTDCPRALEALKHFPYLSEVLPAKKKRMRYIFMVKDGQLLTILIYVWDAVTSITTDVITDM
jgi:hypothetical protein